MEGNGDDRIVLPPHEAINMSSIDLSNSQISSQGMAQRTSYTSESLMAKRGRYATEARIQANRTGIFRKPQKNTVTKPNGVFGS